MGVTEGAWRLKAILFIVVMMTFLYGSEALFLDVEVEGTGIVETFDTVDISSQNLTETDTRELQQESSTDILSTLGFVFEFITFQAPEGIPLWASFFLTIFSSLMIITLVYISYTFIYEFVKGLPFT